GLAPDKNLTVPTDGLPTCAREITTFRLPAMSRARTTANATSPTRRERIACKPLQPPDREENPLHSFVAVEDMTANDLVSFPRGPEEMEFGRPGLERAPQVPTARGGRRSFLILSPSPLSMPILVLGVRLAAPRRRPLPAWPRPRATPRSL